MQTAQLDRRVHIATDGESTTVTLSSLKDEPFVVLLGEPGMGKSTALEHAALHEGRAVLTCRDAMTGMPLPQDGTVFLDALDEYRSGGNGKDKLPQLANLLVASAVTRWRLTSRAEDWREAADLRAMTRAAGNGSIVVATLLPLNRTEALAVLVALGERDSEQFYASALSRGAGAFLESPLSLKLLHTAVVSDGIWPSTRFELFEKATHALAHEHDPERDTNRRPGPQSILETASRLSLFTLASGAEAVWRSNGMPPRDSAYLVLSDLGLPHEETAAALDTALFRGEGHVFYPFHRTVAEFLAARFLARITVGTDGGDAFPLRRAVALITGRDRQAPSELRGLYAWFAAHLHRLGDEQGARRLIERDAATVLAYGDAAAFDTAGRRAMLLNLDRDDPFFLSSHDDSTVLGGLAGEDLTSDFIEILDSEVRGHLQLTVLQALEDGPSVVGIQAKLRQMVFEAGRPLWMRERAAGILIGAAADPGAARAALVAELAAEPLAAGQVMIRARLLALDLDHGRLPAEIRALLADFARLPRGAEDDDIEDRGALSGLAWSFRKSGPIELFDQPVFSRGSRQLRQVSQVRFFIDHALAYSINRSPQLEAARLLTWVGNVREHSWDMLDGSVTEAIAAWLDLDRQARERALFLAIVESGAHDTEWSVINAYVSTVRQYPSDTLIGELLVVSAGQDNRIARRRWLRIAARLARGSQNWPSLRADIVARLEKEGGNTGFIKGLLADLQAKYRKAEEKRIAASNAQTEATRIGNIAEITPVLPEIIAGGDSVSGILAWGAERYRGATLSKEPDPLGPIIRYSSAEIAAAVVEGMIRFAARGGGGVSVEELGAIEASRGSYKVEYIVAAGVHQALVNGRQSDLDQAPLICALMALRQDYFGGDDGATLDAWACRRLAAEPAAAAALFVRYWGAAIGAGGDDLDRLHNLLTQNAEALVGTILTSFIETGPKLSVRLLRQLLSAAARVLTAAEIGAFVGKSLRRSDLTADEEATLRLAALSLDPTGFMGSIPADRLEDTLLRPDGQLAEDFRARCPDQDSLDLLRIRILGASHPARDDDWNGQRRSTAIIRAAIRRLTASSDPAAGTRMKALVPALHTSWSGLVNHAAAEHARLSRDQHHVAPKSQQLAAALTGGPPVNANDLAAVILEVLERYRSTMRTASSDPWKLYWNTDSYGAAVDPKNENEDRNRLLEVMEPRFDKYGVATSLPEAQRSGGTRADILMLSHAGRNLPIEAKRHYNDELWTAPKEQLAGYAADEGAQGYGIYLVFWFGKEFGLPKRPDGEPCDNTAQAIEEALIAYIGPELGERLFVVVLDISRPADMIESVKRRAQKRAKKGRGKVADA